MGLIFTSDPMSHVPFMRDSRNPSFGVKFIPVISSNDFATRGTRESRIPPFRSSLTITDSAPLTADRTFG